MALRLYVDESEDKEQKVFAMGGFIGYAEEWDTLQDKLIARVKPTGVSAYHMIDCECGRGEFTTWSKRDRDQLTADLIQMILDSGVGMLGCAVMLEDYKDLPSLTSEGGRLGKDKWHLMFQFLCMEATQRAMRLPAHESVAFFFDWKEKHGDAFTMLENFRNDARLGEWRHRLGTLTFGHKEFDVGSSIPLLQLADIAAVECRKFVGNPLTRPDLPHPRKSFKALRDADRIITIKVLEKDIIEEIFRDKCNEIKGSQ